MEQLLAAVSARLQRQEGFAASEAERAQVAEQLRLRSRPGIGGQRHRLTEADGEFSG